MKQPAGRLLSMLIMSAIPAVALAAEPPRALQSIDIPFERFTLDNGLTVVVSEDRSLPEVYVEVRYRVGSRDELAGKTGFAHLFEHLMFNGSEHYDDEYFSALRPYGARINGSTSTDRTNYYNIVPTDVLERVLFLESDRMGHLLGALTQQKLDEQRGVVQNEKRQREDRPFSYLHRHTVEALFPEGHPYRWLPIGSMQDLNAATLDDARQWFEAYYGPSNAFLVLVGDIDVEQAKQLTQKYFADIPPGPPVARIDDLVPVRKYNSSETIEDEQARATRLLRYWVIPGDDTEAGVQFLSLADALNDQSSQWLYKSLVEGEQIADRVSASAHTQDLAGWFVIGMNLKEGVSLSQASAALDRVLARFLEQGPSRQQLEGGKTQFAVQVARSLENNSGRAYWLAESESLQRAPDFYKTQLRWYDASTPDSVQALANQWLSQGSHQINIVPYAGKAASEQGVDRSALPVPEGQLAIRVPDIEDTVLDNGVPVRFVHSAKAPLLTVRLEFDGGDALMSAPERAAHALYPQIIGTKTRSLSRDQIIREQKRLGLSVSAAAGVTSTSVTMIGLAARAEESLKFLADTVINARFDDAEFRQQHTNLRKRILEAKNTVNVASLYRQRILYGADHPYASYLPSDVDEISLASVEALHAQYIRAQNLSILVVGDTDLDSVRRQLNRSFGKWKRGSAAGTGIDIPMPARPPGGRVVLFDVPGAEQSSLYFAQALPGTELFDADEHARKIALKELAGHFGSRLNANLREAKGWSYGISGSLPTASRVRSWRVTGSVQTDRTREAIEEILTELEQYGSTRPIEPARLQELQNGEIRGLATASTGSSMKTLGYLAGLRQTGFDDDYLLGLPGIFAQVNAADVARAFAEDFDLQRLTWIITGDLSRIEADIRELELGAVEVWDGDGRRIR